MESDGSSFGTMRTGVAPVSDRMVGARRSIPSTTVWAAAVSLARNDTTNAIVPSSHPRKRRTNFGWPAWNSMIAVSANATVPVGSFDPAAHDGQMPE